MFKTSTTKNGDKHGSSYGNLNEPLHAGNYSGKHSRKNSIGVPGVDNIFDSVSEIMIANQDKNNFSVGGRDYLFEQNHDESSSESEVDP